MFVNRLNGVVNGIYANRQHEGQEEVADDHADVVAYLEAQANPVPSQVSAGQLIQALDDMDLLAAVDAAVDQAGGMTQRLWDRAPTFPRHDPMVEAIATAVGQTEQQLDDIFRLAAAK